MIAYASIVFSCAWFIACVPGPKYFLINANGTVVEIFSDPISCEWAEEELGGTCYTIE